MPALNLKSGARVKLHGLVKTPEHNDLCGVVVREEGERWLVKLDGGKELKLKPANLLADPDAAIKAPKAKKEGGSAEKKRARFGEEGGSVKVTVHETADDEQGSEEEDDDPPFSTWANEVVSLKMLSGVGEAEDRAFSPLFTHQVFYSPPVVKDGERTHEELLIGYESPEVEVVYAANTLRAWIDFRNKGTVPMKELSRAGLLARTNVLSSLEERVPSDYAPRRADVEQDATSDFTPFGALVSSEPAASDEGAFEVYHSCPTTPEEVTYVKRMQTMVTWLIETGSVIQVPDARWNVFYLYRSRPRPGGGTAHALMGFLSAYRYWVYPAQVGVKTPEANLDLHRLRISQCVVLPPYHRQGHGARLLRAVYRHAMQDDKVLDVSVEDPSEDFQALRDATDAKILSDAGALLPLAAPDAALRDVGRRFKLCRSQLRRLATIAKFVSIGERDPEADPERRGDAEFTALRLSVKASLYKQSLCLARGIVSIPDEDAADGEEGEEAEEAEGGGGGKSEARPEPPAPPKADGEAPAGDISEKDVADALAQEQLRVWCDQGDPYERKKALVSMFAKLFRQHAVVASKLLPA